MAFEWQKCHGSQGPSDPTVCVEDDVGITESFQMSTNMRGPLCEGGSVIIHR